MAQSLTDTIVAPITGLGRAAIAVIRVSGPLAWQIGESVLPSLSANPTPRYAHYGRFTTGDDGLGIAFAEGASFTGESTVELHTHGSPASVSLLVAACIAAGARPAAPGEFTMRAFMNGRLDLTQAEAVRDLVEAQTEHQLKTAARQRDGELSSRVNSLRNKVIGALAAVEASTDFSEEVGPVDRDHWANEASRYRSEIHLLLEGLRLGRLLHDGLRIAIVGKPNAGKSSLLNALLREDRALVTEVPGTTRDTVEEVVDLAGIPTRLIDTAGIRESDDAIERLGIDRTRAAIAQADMVWHVYDHAMGWTSEDQELLESVENVAAIVLSSKSDLPAAPIQFPRALPISAMTGEGLSALAETVTQVFEGDRGDSFPINRRHADCLEAADNALAEVERDLTQEVPDDLLAVGLASAVRSLGEITGETTPPDVIDRIFADFCIGK
ncbi:MAG: tRNA uridine-5-carboxymethylaminomethyl(34) synthesis GTPase MnmE [Fimbriimonadaceae bacterium]|nr:tRNA uridine-5-carboxymethylaminomethyl(34) synthesis GTPase MnmE [Fimbriimonadaceae bacterium]